MQVYGDVSVNYRGHKVFIKRGDDQRKRMNRTEMAFNSQMNAPVQHDVFSFDHQNKYMPSHALTKANKFLNDSFMNLQGGPMQK